MPSQLPVVGRHERVTDRRVLQSQCVADLMGGHHEQVVSLVSVQRPPLRHVEVGLAALREEGVGQGSAYGKDNGEVTLSAPGQERRFNI